MRKYKLVEYILFLVLAFTQLNAQSGDSMPLDGSIRYGRLPNGLTYYIKALKSSSKIHLRFYVKAGFYQQDADQQNIPHVLEHLAFRSSKQFPEGIYSNVGLLDSIGMRQFDLGGFTGYRVTYYNFDVPSDSEVAFNTGLAWFRDIATGLKLLESDINIERGALKQEFLIRQGSKIHENFTHTKLYSKLFPCRKDRSDYFEYHTRFPPSVLRSFYRDWYRPDLMAVSIVGNINNLDLVEKRIKEQFSDIPPHKNPRIQFDCDSLYFQRPPQFEVVVRNQDTLKPVPNDVVDLKIFFRDPITQNKIQTIQGVQRQIMMELFSNLLNERFKKAEDAYADGLQIHSEHSFKFNRSPSALMVNITSAGHNQKLGLQRAISILYQVREQGFDDGEWKRVKEPILRSMEFQGEQYWIDEISRHFIIKEPLPPNKQDILKTWLTNLTVREFNVLVNSFIGMPEDIGIIAPVGHDALSYTEQEVRKWIADVYSSPIKQQTEIEVPTSLMSAEEISKLKEIGYEDNGYGISGAREFILENGIKVVLMAYKPSKGVNANKISLHGFSPYGSSDFRPEDYFSAINAPDIVKNTGVGEMDKIKLRRFLENTESFSMGLHPYIDYKETGIIGEVSMKEFEVMLQLVYLYYVAPNKNDRAFENWKNAKEQEYLNVNSNLISNDFYNSIREITGDSSLARILGKTNLSGTKGYNSIRQTDLGAAYSIYQKLYGRASDFTFIISGSFNVPSILPLIQKYLGNLPNKTGSMQIPSKDSSGSSLPVGPIINVIPVPTAEMKNVAYALKYIKNTDMDTIDWKELIKVDALAAIAEMKLWQLRFSKGYALYMVGVGGDLNYGMSRFEFIFQFDCEQEELPMLRKECKDIITEIKSRNIGEEFFQQGIKRLQAIYDVGRSNTSRQMQKRLYEHYRFGNPWIVPKEMERYVGSLKEEDIVNTAKKYFVDRNLFEFVMGNEVLQNSF